MGPLEIVGFITCLFALAFTIGFGLVLGVRTGMHVGALAFGPWTINVNKFVREIPHQHGGQS